MDTNRKQQLQKLAKDMRRAYDLAGEGNLAEACRIYQGVEEHLRGMGLDIVRALDVDPLSQPFQNSFDVIVGRIRAALAAGSRADDDPSTPRLYDLLVSADEADVPSHAAMARWLSAKGELDRAGTIAEALVTLHPGDPLSWRCKAEVARASGDAATADACMAEAAARGSAPAPFAVPGVAQG
ncbi:MAG TPA: hypothetical protein VFM53_06615 [Anaeromyxobacteraceae bacterium]|nr:hypothetical protein [Anaeromyxobacteraceae bacterium]